jgi:hypothetical protein
MLVLYVPVGQAVQAAMEVDAVLLLYVPAGHCLQALEPSIEYEPLGQAEQVAVLTAEANVPAAHEIHTTAPTLEYVPIGHGRHVGCLVRCWYVPAEHWTQAPDAVAPVLGFAVPALQEVHSIAAVASA